MKNFKIKLRINHKRQEFNTDKLEIILSDTEQFTIRVNNDNSININKNMDGPLSIKPCVSNVIEIK